MSKGSFINFNLPYKEGIKKVSSNEQAKHILDKAKDLLQGTSKGVAITYSANYGQTKKIIKIYMEDNWNTETAGANQADVMNEMERLLGGEYSDLQCKMRIAPISTMDAYTNRIDSWKDKHMGIVEEDLNRIKEQYLEKGWDVLGWQNQKTLNSTEHPYAIGGGIAKLPDDISNKIQHTLITYSQEYPSQV